jgi:hypothetical protein
MTERQDPLVPMDDLENLDLYGNYLDIHWTANDLSVRVAKISPRNAAPESGELVRWQITQVATVTFPWPQAKSLRDLLTQAVERYENSNGEIVQPKLP